MQTAALIFLSALLSASSAQPLEYIPSLFSIPHSSFPPLLSLPLPPSVITNNFPYRYSSHLTLTMPWHPPPPPNSDLRLKLKPKHKQRMLMPDSPQPSPPSSWRLGTQLPVSYRVAIAVDAIVLLITILSLVLLGVYIRRQYRRRKSSLLHGKEEYDFDDEESLGDSGKDGEAGGEMERGVERKKKGHVRWTSSVVGMGVFAGRVDEGKVRLGGEEGERGWGCDARGGRAV
jgi:hypothetical protein